MSNPAQIDLFVEDRAHEEYVRSLVQRIADEQRKPVSIHIRSARGGHGRVISEFKTYQSNVLLNTAGLNIPDVLIVAIDANCKSYNTAKQEITSSIDARLAGKTVLALPDPHIERWYLADLENFFQTVGTRPVLGKKKCKRDLYKNVLSRAIADAGHPPTLGGIEFARDLVASMDFYRAGKAERSLKHFLDDISSSIGHL